MDVAQGCRSRLRVTSKAVSIGEDSREEKQGNQSSVGQQRSPWDLTGGGPGQRLKCGSLSSPTQMLTALHHCDLL